MLGPAAVILLTVVLVLATRWGAVTASQPAYLATLLLAGAVSVVGIAWSLVDVGRARARDEARPRPRPRVVAVRVLGIAGTVLLVAALVWLRPLPATAVAEAAMSGTPAVRVVDATSRIDLVPTGHAAATGLVFFPGALVDPRAYVPLLTSLAAHGFPVVVVKPPYGIAFLAAGAPSGIIADDPSVTRWVIGGHSLGGTVAAIEADSHDDDAVAPAVGLLLYASYPATDMSSSLRASVLSVSGTLDGLATPAKIDASRPTLPQSSVFVAIEGAVHAYFGDYGEQPGDGTPTISHDDARRQISAKTLTYVDGLD